MNRYLTGVFKGDSTMTIGVDFHMKKVEIEGKRVGLQIWDFAGEDRFRFLLPSYVRGAAGGIFMYDITRYSSIKNFGEWMDVVKQGRKTEKSTIPIIMCGGKLDLEDKRAISSDDGYDEVSSNAMTECRTIDGDSVEIFHVDPSDFFKPFEMPVVRDSNDAKKLFLDGLSGKDERIADIFALNAALALATMGEAELGAGFIAAKEQCMKGMAVQKLYGMVGKQESGAA